MFSTNKVVNVLRERIDLTCCRCFLDILVLEQVLIGHQWGLKQLI